MEFTVRDNAILIRLDKKSVANLVFHVEGKKMFLDSTFTPERYRGRGIGSELVKASIDYAEKNGLTIVPVCDFAVDYFRKHKEYDRIVQHG
jgi:predicted GNAT family acetyltransferase